MRDSRSGPERANGVAAQIGVAPVLSLRGMGRSWSPTPVAVLLTFLLAPWTLAAGAAQAQPGDDDFPEIAAPDATAEEGGDPDDDEGNDDGVWEEDGDDGDDGDDGESAPADGAGPGARGATRAGDEDERGATEPAGDEEEGDEGDEEEREAEDAPPGGTTARLIPAADGSDDGSTLILPPLYIADRGDVHTTAVFPFYYSREAPDDYQLLAGPYFRRRGSQLDADVAFPFYWSFRGEDHHTWAVPPIYHHGDADGFDLGVAPLFFGGRDKDSTYTVIPPLLTVAWADDEQARTFAGPFYRLRDREKLRWGVFPFLWVNEGDDGSSVMAPPFFFRFTDDLDETALTIVPPFYHHQSPTRVTYGLAPLFHHRHGAEMTSTTIPPLLFHYSEAPNTLRLVTPLFGYLDEDGARTLITPLYQRYRGATETDAVFPLFFSHRDPRQYAASLWVSPLFWHSESPAGNETVVFPFFGLWQEHGRYTAWATPLAASWESHEEDAAANWIFPTLQVSHTPSSSTINLHPLVYSTTATTHRHLVVAPLYWDFEDYEDDSRTSIFFPVFWRFRDGATVDQLAGNTYYRHYRRQGEPGWEFHFFPLFAYGEPAPGDYFWSVLYGLAGYRRQGAYGQASALWIPFQTSGPASEP